MDAKLPKSERLHRQSEIDACYRSGKRASGPLLRVHLRPNELPIARLAISVPGRLCNAVRRNRWKRMVREAFRLNKAALGTGFDVVVVPNKPPEGLKRQDVEATLIDLIRRVRSRP